MLSSLILPAFGAPISEKTGLKQQFDIDTGGYDFTVDTVSSFDITDVSFDADQKKITLYIVDSVSENLSEIQIPRNLINGNFTFFLNDIQIFPKVQYTDKISFITLEFSGNGSHQLDIIGTTYLPEFSDIAPLVLATSLFALIFLFKRFNHSFSNV